MVSLVTDNQTPLEKREEEEKVVVVVVVVVKDEEEFVEKIGSCRPC